MADYKEDELVAVDYDSIVDRSELSTCFDVGEDEPVWLPNAEIQSINETEQVVKIPAWLAKDRGLV